MGGASTTTWRGVTVDPTTAGALDEAAILVGDDITLRPIQGSYSTSTSASGGTHAGGGAIDISASGYTDEQARRIETTLRRVGFAAWFRPAISGVWARHVHGIRVDCTDLSSTASQQVTWYRDGLNGLWPPSQAKDTGSRAYVGMTWAKYQEEYMPTVDEIWNKKFASPTDGKEYYAGVWLVNANVKAGEAKALASQALAQVAALTAAFKALAAHPDLSVDQITAAAKAGAQAALDEKITGADVTLKVDPAP